MPEEKDKNKIKVEIVKEEILPKLDTKENGNKETLYFEEEELAKRDKKDENQPDMNKNSESDGEKTPFFILFLVFLFGLVIGAGLIGGIFYYKIKMEDTRRTVQVEETPNPENEKQEEKAPTPIPQEVNIKDLKVLILNGSGIKGEAKRVENLLKEERFENIETGNADSYTYNDTIVYLKENLGDTVYEKIEKSLSEFSLKKDVLDKDSPYDIKIIVGKTRK